MSRHGLARRLRDERGSVLVVAGVMAVVFVLLGAVIVEVGQWFEHRRAIQTRADAAALAGGQELAQCFNVGVNGMTGQQVDTLIESWAQSYGGVAGGALGSTTYNPQFGNSSSDLMSFQSNTYPSAGDPQPTEDLGSECTNLMLDVKLTQAGIPPLFSISPLATVHGWARVALQKIVSSQPAMPLAVPDVRPHNVAVTFVDASGNALTGCKNADGTAAAGCVFQLHGPNTVGQLNNWSSYDWTNNTDGSVTIPMPAANGLVAMRVGIGSWTSGNNGNCAGVNEVHSSTENYVCYDYNSQNSKASSAGIVDLRAYSATDGTPTSPVLQAVNPTPTNPCSVFFSIFQAPGGTCDAGVTATVSFGGAKPPQGAAVEATINGTTVSMTNASTSTTPSNEWVSDTVSLPIEGGPYPVTMSWCTSGCTNQNKFTSFNSGKPVQQIFSGSDNSSSVLPGGPIFAATVANGANYSYSFPANNDATINVVIGLAGGVHLPVRCPISDKPNNTNTGGNYTCSTDPPVLLRFTTVSGNKSQTYAIDCGGGNLRYMIENGCANQYSLNAPDLCPDLSNTSQYPDCVPTQTGAITGQVHQGMNARFAPNGKCLANNYPAPPSGDKRAVTLIITDFSAFTGSGNALVPVITFATFYITGWDSADASCQGINEPPPPADSVKGNGSNIWGHYIADITSGTPSGETCPGAGITPCVPALVR